MNEYSIKIPIDRIAVRMPLSMADGDNFTISFKDETVIEDIISQLETLLISKRSI